MTLTRYEKATRCEPVDRPPIWVMRQAGRYLPEYREVRKNHSFLEMTQTPEIATEITLQPIRRYGMDAAIIFSDILVIPAAMGMELNFIEGKGPVFESPIRHINQLNDLDEKAITDKLQYVIDALTLVKQELPSETALIGFAGAPFTVASYMIEGGSSKTLSHTTSIMKENPEFWNTLMAKITDATITYALNQAKTGIQGFQLFDTWACYLSNEDFSTYALPYIKRIVDALKQETALPVTLFAKDTTRLAPLLASSTPSVISADEKSSLSQLRDTLGPTIALQGNLDPQSLFESDKILTQKVTALLKEMQTQPGHIFNLGHGMTPTMDPEKLQLVVDLVKNSSSGSS